MQRKQADPAISGWWPSPLDDGAVRDRRPTPRRRRRGDVVVIGAGLSGLVAAERLAREGASVVVLEARPNRVGGRLETLAGTADLGGAFVGAEHWSVRELLLDLGLHTFPTYDRGARVTLNGGGTHGDLRRRVTARGVRRAVEAFDRLASTVPLDDPAGAPGAAALDARHLGSWLTTETRGRAREVLAAMFGNVLGAEPGETSLLHALWYARTGGGLRAQTSTLGGAQQDLVVGGAQAIADRLAARLEDTVELGAPVREIAHAAGGVVVTAERVEVHADTAIVAVPPVLRERIAFDPAPRAPRRRLSPGDAMKYVAVYDDPFWRAEGLSGMAWGDALPFSFTHDVSPLDGGGVLAIFVVADRAKRLRALPAEHREPVVLDALERSFGPRARSPLALAGRDWTADPWSRAGYGSVAEAGWWTSERAVGDDDPARVIFAGTESGIEGHGYMEGAVRAGQLAAHRVLQRV